MSVSQTFGSPAASSTAFLACGCRCVAGVMSTSCRVPGRAGVTSRGEPGELLVDDGRVELGEDRRRLLHRRPRYDGTTLPPGHPGVVAGEDRVPRSSVEVV